MQNVGAAAYLMVSSVHDFLPVLQPRAATVGDEPTGRGRTVCREGARTPQTGFQPGVREALGRGHSQGGVGSSCFLAARSKVPMSQRFQVPPLILCHRLSERHCLVLDRALTELVLRRGATTRMETSYRSTFGESPSMIFPTACLQNGVETPVLHGVP